MTSPPVDRRFVLASGSAVLLAGGSFAGPARALAADATGRLLDARLAEQGVGLLAVQTDGTAVDVVARGRARGSEPLESNARFEVGSLTKTFTGLLLADAVVRRELSLDAPVEAAWSDSLSLRDSAGQPIRWIDLATHRSGLPRLADTMAPADPADPYSDFGDAALIAFLRGWRPTRQRDEHWAYSNLGYGLLGWALARRARTGYAALLGERVLGPLGLNDTAVATPRLAIPRLVDGHDAAGRPVSHWTFADAAAGAGALVTSGADLARYLQAAVGARTTPLAEAFALAMRERAPGPGAGNPMALGWIRAPLAGRTVLNHDGGTFGFSSSTWLDPARGRAIAVLANAQVEVQDLAIHLLEPSLPPKDFAPTRQAEVALGLGQLAQLAGRYAVSPSFAIEVTVRAGQLWAQATGQGAFQLFAAGPRHFFAKITPLDVEFEAGDPPPSIVLTQGGRTTRFERE